MKEETEQSAKADTQKADLRDKYNTLLYENKQLKMSIEGKFSADKFNSEQELLEAKRDLNMTLAKNKQLENRIVQLEGRLAGQ